MLKCPSCEESNHYEIDQYNEYKILRCRNCDLIFADPFINPGAKFYEQFYQNIGLHDPDRFGLNPSQKLFFRRNNLGKMLDVACGMGIFLNGANKRGFNVYGVDFDSESIKLCKDHFKLENIYNYSVDDEKIKKLGKFDYVSLIDVLEHVDNPNKLLQDLKKLLNNNGKLIISVPNYNRNPDYIFEAGDNPPHHLTKWTTKSLSFILKKNGFKVVYCKPLKFTSVELVDFFRTIFYTRTINKIKKINKLDLVKEAQNNDILVKNEFKSSLRNKVLFKIRDFILLILSIILIPVNLILVWVFRLKADHIYAEATKK